MKGRLVALLFLAAGLVLVALLLSATASGGPSPDPPPGTGNKHVTYRGYWINNLPAVVAGTDQVVPGIAFDCYVPAHGTRSCTLHNYRPRLVVAS